FRLLLRRPSAALNVVQTRASSSHSDTPLAGLLSPKIVSKEILDRPTEATARRHWPGQNPIGQVLTMGSSAGGPEYRIVGVVRDAERRNIGETPSSFLYFPARPGENLQHLVKTEADFASTAADVRAAVAALDPEVLVEITPLENNL